MRGFGSTLLFLGIGTLVLDFIGYEFVILSWIHHWGPGVAWGIIGTMVATGGVLFFLGGSESGGAA